MTTYLGRPVFPLDLNLLPDEQRWIYDDTPEVVGLNGPATLGAQSFAKQRVSLQTDSVNADAREEVEAWLASIDTEARSMWFPCDLGEVFIREIEDAGAMKIRIAGQAWQANLALAAGMFLRLFSPDGIVSRAKVTAVEAAGADEILTLDAWPAGLSPAWHLSRLILGRVISAAWRHESEGLSTLEISALELPLEYAGPAAADETVRADVWLYTITRRITASDIVCWRMTSAPDAVTHDGAIYVAAQIDHDRISTSTEGDTDQLSLRLGHWQYNPFLSWFPRHSAGSFGVIVDRVGVNRATATSVGAATRVFRGDVEEVTRQGPVYSVQCASPLALSNARVPGFMIQTFCNYALYDANTCKVSEAAYRLTGELAAVNADASRVDFECADLAGKDSSWLVRGYISITIGGEVETRYIRSVSVLSGTRHRLTLNMPTVLSVAGADAVALPGCDKSVTICHARFNNRKRFGGHPELPSYNPSVAALRPKTASGGGKK